MHRPFFRLIPKIQFKPTNFFLINPTPTVCFSYLKPNSNNVSEKPSFSESSTAKALLNDLGLQKHLNKMYKTTIMSFAGALGVSYLMAATNFALLSPMHCFCVGALGTISTVIAFCNRTTCQIQIVSDSKGQEYLKSENSPGRLGLYTTFVGLNGLMMAPLIGHFLFISPIIIPIALGLSTGIVAGSSIYTYTRPKGSLLWLGGPLTGALLTVISIQMISLGAAWIYGPNMISMLAYRTDIYLGTGMFAVFVAYDTHLAVEDYEEGKPDHLLSSMGMFLNFQNIFLRMMKIVASFFGES